MDLVAPSAPEEIFPLEIWEQILDHVRSPSDLINCNQTCKAFPELLEHKKTTFLMPKVFPILYQYLEALEQDEEEEDFLNGIEEERETAITTILKMRLVSQGWMESVDGYHQNYPVLCDIGFEEWKTVKKCPHLHQPFPLIPYHFLYGDSHPVPKLENFLRKGFSPGSNRLITRYVRYCDFTFNKRGNSRFRTAFKNFLKAFGSQIWTCELVCFTRLCKNMAEVYKLVGSYLRLMPNIRSLRIEFISDGMPKTDSEQELELLLQNEPLPRLQHLRTLAMRNIPYPLSVRLLAKNEKLQKLLLLKWCDDNCLLPDYVINAQLPNLKQLAFTCSERELLQLPKLRWPIKALRLIIQDGEEVLKNIFPTVSSTFGDTLEHFVVEHWTGRENNEELKEIRLELPALKIFQLNIPLELDTIDFLQGCPALQEITLDFLVPHKKEDDKDSLNSFLFMDENDNEVIKFKDCINSMNQSNIWQILSTLQTITITTNGMESKVDHTGGKAVSYVPDETHKFTRRQFEKFFNRVPNFDILLFSS